MSVVESKLRTGTLMLGSAGDQIHASCQATSVVIASAYKESGDAVEVLCGTNLTPEATVTKSLKITAIQDFDDADGLMVWLRDHELETVDFAWQANPTSEIAVGVMQVRLGDWGGEVGKRLTHTPEWPIAELDWLAPPPPATGATAGLPGTFTPPGSAKPANLAAMETVAANPVTAWATGEYVILLDASEAYWNSTDWLAGRAP